MDILTDPIINLEFIIKDEFELFEKYLKQNILV